MKKTKVMVILDDDLASKLLCMAKTKSGYRGSNSKNKRIKNKVLKRIMCNIMEQALEFSIRNLNEKNRNA